VKLTGMQQGPSNVAGFIYVPDVFSLAFKHHSGGLLNMVFALSLKEGLIAG